MSPNETRSSRRAVGSGRDKDTGNADAEPAAARRYCTERRMFHATATRAMINRTTRPWCRRAAWKAETIAGLFVLKPVFMPGMAVPSPG